MISLRLISEFIRMVISKISKEDLAKMAWIFLQKLDDQKILNTEDLEKMLNTSIPIEGDYSGKIDIRHGPSEGGMALVADYALSNQGGVPIEGIFNKRFDYTFIAIKTAEPISGYQIVSRDSYKNLMQALKKKGSDLAVFREELGRLEDLPSQF